MSGLSSPLILKYEKALETNPKSRVFAPLAESYRKLGQVDRAMQVLKDGLRHHPNYLLGHLGLAFCYFDIEEFNLAYNTLKPFVKDNRDNLRLMKLYAQICLRVKAEEEALDAFKYLLFLNPRDKETAENVSRLEDSLNSSKVKISFTNEKGEEDSFTATTGFNVEKLSAHPSQAPDVDEWIQIDFKSDETDTETSDDLDKWNLNKGEAIQTDQINDQVEGQKNIHTEASEREFSVEVNNVDEEEKETNSFESVESPVITHTLVDLYCKQGHIEKACEILENILALNPNDQRTKDKLQEILLLLPKEEEKPQNELAIVEEPEEISVRPFEQSEEEGREHLMSYFNDETSSLEEIDEPTVVEKVAEIVPQTEEVKVDIDAIESKLWAFNKKIQERASEYLSSRI